MCNELGKMFYVNIGILFYDLFEGLKEILILNKLKVFLNALR